MFFRAKEGAMNETGLLLSNTFRADSLVPELYPLLTFKFGAFVSSRRVDTDLQRIPNCRVHKTSS